MGTQNPILRRQKLVLQQQFLIDEPGDVSIAAKDGAILAGEKEPGCGLRDGLLQG